MSEDKKPLPQKPSELPVNKERELPNLSNYERAIPEAQNNKWTSVDTVSDSSIKKGADSSALNTKAGPKED